MSINREKEDATLEITSLINQGHATRVIRSHRRPVPRSVVRARRIVAVMLGVAVVLPVADNVTPLVPPQPQLTQQLSAMRILPYVNRVLLRDEGLRRLAWQPNQPARRNP